MVMIIQTLDLLVLDQMGQVMEEMAAEVVVTMEEALQAADQQPECALILAPTESVLMPLLQVST